MSQDAEGLTLLLITVGAILLVAPGIEVLSRKTRLPRVSLLLLLGVLFGPMALDTIPAERAHWYPGITRVALAMVGFLLGGEFTLASLRARGRDVFVTSLAVSLGTGLIVGGGLYLLDAPLAVALILGTAATATDPAAVASVIRDGDARGSNTSLLRGIVAVDDVWGLMLFAIVLSVLQTFEAAHTSDAIAQVLGHAALELGGSLLLGGALGLAMAAVTGRLKPGEPTRLEALGFVLLCCGAASYLELSYLLSAVMMGAVVSNVATHHEVAFHEIEEIETPFLVVFFVLSGATAEFHGDTSSLLMVLAYVGLRMLGRLVAGGLGVLSSRGDFDKLIGLALLPQAGVALGMTLIAVEEAPDIGPRILPVVILSTVLFESFGPILTAWHLRRVGEVGDRGGDEDTSAPAAP